MTDESDDSSLKVELKQRKWFDDCCKDKVDINKIVMEGNVKVRRKLFFYR